MRTSVDIQAMIIKVLRKQKILISLVLIKFWNNLLRNQNLSTCSSVYFDCSGKQCFSMHEYDEKYTNLSAHACVASFLAIHLGKRKKKKLCFGMSNDFLPLFSFYLLSHLFSFCFAFLRTKDVCYQKKEEKKQSNRNNTQYVLRTPKEKMSNQWKMMSDKKI